MKKTKLTPLQIGIRNQQAKRKEQETLRDAVLKKNAPEAVRLANKALDAVHELIELEKAMLAEAPEIGPSFSDEGHGQRFALEDAEHAICVVRHQAEKLVD